MMIDGHDIHVDDVFARWIESRDGHFHCWKHTSKSMSTHFIETEFDQVVERVHAQMDVTPVAVIRSMYRTSIDDKSHEITATTSRATDVSPLLTVPFW